jgi:hypothetical protein
MKLQQLYGCDGLRLKEEFQANNTLDQRDIRASPPPHWQTTLLFIKSCSKIV